MREIELKAVVDDVAKRRKLVEGGGAKLTFDGKLRDQRYDSEARELAGKDEVLRVRSYQTKKGTETFLDWKGPTEIRDVYKVREEISTRVEDRGALAAILDRLGYTLTREIDRDIAQYKLGGCTIRFETYPRMDTLVEVEGEPEQIETAIESLGMARGSFTSERLAQFVERFEQRTGVRGAISDRELAGDYSLRFTEG
ncbi:MAG TPA: class IV adenylate cyclase [Gemmatimonadaceae bacterium]|nr:class IV adenylate cyclase [Gemmatimonadaceae bacterium]